MLSWRRVHFQNRSYLAVVVVGTLAVVVVGTLAAAADTLAVAGNLAVAGRQAALRMLLGRKKEKKRKNDQEEAKFKKREMWVHRYPIVGQPQWYGQIHWRKIENERAVRCSILDTLTNSTPTQLALTHSQT